MNTKLKYTQNWVEVAREANWSAKRCNVSVRTLERYFLKQKGKTPKAWLAETRRQLAVELLRKGTSVKETASLAGYRHASTFAREFKKSTGQCPNALTLIQENKQSNHEMSHKALHWRD
jgi:AraC-like DNA-binding protein